MPAFKNFKDLASYIEKQVQHVMGNEVSEKVEQIMQDEIEQTVYETYDPVVYERRNENEGLLDKRNIISTLSSTGTGIQVKNIAKRNDDYGGGIYPLDEVIVYGGDYYEFQGDGKGAYLEPRDFYQSTYDALEKNKAHVEALKEGLKKCGIHCK